jgi:protein-S-isoprenylcysteine O-methyltransferase Ste14
VSAEPASSRAAVGSGGDQPDAAGVLAPPPLIYLSGLAVGFGLEGLLPSAPVPDAVSWGAGAVLLLGGGLLARSFFRALGRAGTTISPYGATTALVTTGPYRISRNPGYLGLALAYAGIALLSGALWPFASLVPTLALIDRGVIAREERYLERKFGDQYRRYRRQTRRWL